MATSFLKSLAYPPVYDERLSEAQWQTVTKIRLLFIALALVVDLALLVGLDGNPLIDADTLRLFFAINVPIIAVIGLVAAAQLRVRALRKIWVVCASSVAEAFTIIVWVQVTGTLTTYFVLVGALIALWYRLYYGWAVALSVTLALFLFHGGAVALEIAGVLRPEALFIGAPSRAYTVPVYQGVVISSIVWLYMIVFFGANAVTNKLREKDRALAEVQREAARVAEEVKHGRLTGTLLDDEYALGELLGRGGMGEIYVARRVSNDSTVAVKVLHGHLISDDTVLERFRRESAVAARVPQQHTARILGFGHDETLGIHYISMEYLRGEDLGAYLRRRGALTPDELLPLARRIAAALDAAHGVGVVHRDLKPQNVFLLAEGHRTGSAEVEVRLLDFGMSKLADVQDRTLTQVNAIIGTIGYMAPEQALGRVDEIGAPADVFAFAAILYRALTGKLPFQAGDVLAAIREVAHVHPPPPSTLQPRLHPDVDAVLAIGLAKGVAERYASASELVDDLEAAARGRLAEDKRARAHSIHSGVAEAATLTAGV